MLVWKRLKEDSRFRRLMVLWFLGVLLLAVAGATAALIGSVSSSSATVADHLAEVSDFLTGGTLVLALIAAIVAVMAYAIATGLPNLEFNINFESSDPNRPVFRASDAGVEWLKVNASNRTIGTISLQNTSGYTARNPAVIVELKGLAFLPAEFSVSEGWVTIDHIPHRGVTAVQWDGGPSYSIHGHSVRHLPALNFQGLQRKLSWPESPSLWLVLLADGGYRREFSVSIDFTVDGKPQFLKDGFKALPTKWI